MCDIHVVYSTLEYDVILGVIEKTKATRFHIGQHVIVFYTYAQNAFASNMKDPLRYIRVDDRYVFPLPHQDLFTPAILPIVKYGFIFFSIGSNITLEAPTNVQKLYQRIARTLTNNDSIQEVIIQEDRWSVNKKVYDVQKHGLIELFGSHGVDAMLDTIVKYNLLADVIYLPISELTSNMIEMKPKSTRFFIILCYYKK